MSRSADEAGFHETETVVDELPNLVGPEPHALGDLGAAGSNLLSAGSPSLFRRAGSRRRRAATCSAVGQIVRLVCSIPPLTVCLGAVLFVSATLKLSDLPNRAGGMFVLTAVQSGFEVALAVGFASGVCGWVVRLVGLFSFAAFSTVAVYHLWSGDGSCGCFGAVSVSPLAMLLFNIAVTAYLWRWTPGFCHRVAASCLRSGLGVFAAIMIAGAIMLFVPTARDALVAGVAAYNRTPVTIDPEEWLARKCPIISSIETPVNISSGRWTVVFYRRNCKHCRRFLDGLRVDASPAAALRGNSGQRRIALIEVPPYSAQRDTIVVDHPSILECVAGRLSEASQWKIAVPVAFVMAEGTVIEVPNPQSILAQLGRGE
jgi:hypothetical protein